MKTKLHHGIHPTPIRKVKKQKKASKKSGKRNMSRVRGPK